MKLPGTVEAAESRVSPAFLAKHNSGLRPAMAMAKRSLISTTGFANYGGAEHLRRSSFVTGTSVLIL